VSKLNPHKMARPKVRSNPSSHTAEMSATSSPSRTGTVAGIASGLSIVRRQTARSFTTAWVAIRAAPAWVAGGDRRPGNAHTTYRTGPRRASCGRVACRGAYRPCPGAPRPWQPRAGICHLPALGAAFIPSSQPAQNARSTPVRLQTQESPPNAPAGSCGSCGLSCHYALAAPARRYGSVAQG